MPTINLSCQRSIAETLKGGWSCQVWLLVNVKQMCNYNSKEDESKSNTLSMFVMDFFNLSPSECHRWSKYIGTILLKLQNHWETPEFVRVLVAWILSRPLFKSVILIWGFLKTWASHQRFSANRAAISLLPSKLGKRSRHTEGASCGLRSNQGSC